MSRAAVTVVIPTRNRWTELTRFALRAVLSQHDVRAEVIVVDDGSDVAKPDPSPFDHPRLELIELGHNRGVAAARNVGIQAAKTEWVAFLDDDDMWAPHRLTRMISAAAKTGGDFAYCDVLVVDATLRPTRLLPAPAADQLVACVARSNAIYAAASNLIVRRELLNSIGGFDEAFSVCADWELVARLARAGTPCPVRAPLLVYRASGWMVDAEELHREDLRRLAVKHPWLSIDWSEFERALGVGFHREGRRGKALQRLLKVAIRERDLRSFALAGATLVDRSRLERFRGRRLSEPQWLSLYREA